jgi:large subunit ribosomal protein L23
MSQNQLSDEKLFSILIAPRQTEKSASLEVNRQYVFRVKNDATKPEIKMAVEKMLSVTVESVRVCNVKSKSKRFGQFIGQRKGWKKAYVMLAKEQVLKFTGV